MQRTSLIAAFIVALTVSEQALACFKRAPLVLEDVQYADVVVVGKISNYRIIRDEDFRQRMLSNPNISAEDRSRFEGDSLLFYDYTRFEIKPDEVLAGSAPGPLVVTWDTPEFARPEEVPTGAVLIAVRKPSSKMPPLRVGSAPISRNAEGLSTVVQAPCAPAFFFDGQSNEAKALRKILEARK